MSTIGKPSPSVPEAKFLPPSDIDMWGMDLAWVLSSRANCRRRRVGSVILDGWGGILGAGWNSVAEGFVSCLRGGCPRGLQSYADVPAGQAYDSSGPERCYSVHAEVAAILDWKESARKAAPRALYVTANPCPSCRNVTWSTDIKMIIRTSKTGEIIRETIASDQSRRTPPVVAADPQQ